MEKTATNGYYKLPNGRMLHFSMNAWYNLKEDTGLELKDYGVATEKGTDMEKAVALSQIVFSAAKAYDQEEGIVIDYNIYNIRSLFGSIITAKEISGITKAIMWNSDPGTPKGEKKVKGTKKNPQP